MHLMLQRPSATQFGNLVDSHHLILYGAHMAAHRNSLLIRRMAHHLAFKAHEIGLPISNDQARDLALAAYDGWQEVYSEIYAREMSQSDILERTLNDG